ncbi:MAG: alpha/beta fold hydrolase [Oscillospiraceae bacterium]|nr:alpha/beta fold hydrolase [Oscillospiraceae bacterium]
MIVKKEAYYSSDNRINKIRALVWEDQEKSPSGVVQIIPSLGDHIGRYDEIARHLALQGFVVCGNDHIGNGKSVSSSVELGAVTDNADVTVIRDVNTLHRIMAKRYKELPYYIIGAGVGSFIARIYAGAFSEQLSGAVFIGTSQMPDFVWALNDPLNALMSNLPREVSSAAALNTLFGKITKRLYKDNSELSWLSVNEQNLAEYIGDPLTGFGMTRQMTAALIKLLLKGSLRENAEKLPSDFKVMFLSGAKDSVGFFGRGVISASDIYAAAGLSPEVILYPTDRHEILRESDREKVFTDIAEFLLK